MRFGTPLLVSRQEGCGRWCADPRGHAFYFLPDMDFGPRFHLRPVLRRARRDHQRAAAPAALTGAKVVPVITRQVAPATRSASIHRGRTIRRGIIEADVRRMNAFIEERALEMPEQYFLGAQALQDAPPGEPSPYE
jgi:KDO2-lipid IV(A) lauroyltransferase